MATLSSTRLRPDTLKGFALLQEFCANRAVGVLPHTLVDRLKREYEFDFSDLKESAIGLDRSESSGIERGILEQLAYRLGKHDGGRIIAALRGLSSEMDEQDFRFAVKVSETLPESAKSIPPSVLEEYKRGLVSAAAMLYVMRNDPMLWRTQVAETRATRMGGDGAVAEDLVESTRIEMEVARNRDVSEYAAAVSAYALAVEAADRVAAKALIDRAVETAKADPRLTPAVALQRARVSFRTGSEDGELSRKASARAAWIPVSMAIIRDRTIESRHQTLAPEMPRAFNAPRPLRPRAAALR